MKNKKIISLILALVLCLGTVCPAYASVAEGDFNEITTQFVTQEVTTSQETTTQATITEETTTQVTTTEETTTQVPTTEETTTEEAITEEPTTEETTTEEPTTEEPTTEEPTTQEPTTEPEEEKPVYGEDDTVALMHVYYIKTSIHPIGHCWVYIENLTGEELTVGLYTVPPYEGVSVGVFCRKDGLGVYYNVEAYSQTTYGMEGQISMCEELTYDEVDDVTDAILGFLNHWDPFFNCMYFAFKVWNSVSDRKLISIVFPIFGKLQMKFYSHDYNVPMKPVRMDQTYRQKGTGKNAYLKQATEKVLGQV